MIDHTNDPQARSWLVAAQATGCDFTLQNLPHGVFRSNASNEPWRGCVAIGDQVLDVAAALHRGLIAPAARAAAQAAAAPQLNGLMALGHSAWQTLRRELWRLLREGAAEQALLRECLVPQAAAEHRLPADVGDFTDFFTSWHHMVNAGRVFQPDAPPLPNFSWQPLAYHGRASSVAVSGTVVQRPRGQVRAPGDEAPRFGAVQRLDYELELGAWVGTGSAHGTAIPVGRAEEHLFGLCLLNDWSARDVQAWEAQPLGPFLAKNFHTSVSPWVVTLQALAPFRCALPDAARQRPTLAHLQAPGLPGFDIQLEAWLQTARGAAALRLSRSSFRHNHWALAQMVAHHTEGGCPLRTGDLLGTGTQSGPGADESGCLLELTHGGRQPVVWPCGTARRYLEDGDTVTLRAWAEAPGAARVGFGTCTGTVVPAPS